jgi:hypothetical protein
VATRDVEMHGVVIIRAAPASRSSLARPVATSAEFPSRIFDVDRHRRQIYFGHGNHVHRSRSRASGARRPRRSAPDSPTTRRVGHDLTYQAHVRGFMTVPIGSGARRRSRDQRRGAAGRAHDVEDDAECRVSATSKPEGRCAVKFALFYEIPVPRPWTPGRAAAYQNVIRQAVLGGDGFHSLWTVEHHFLEAHCSNPEVLYGAIAAAKTSRLRLGYGVRLLPRPYNHPVRTAESVAVLDLLSDGRVEFGTGRSATRAELEGFGIDPKHTRAMWQESIEHIVGCWTNDESSSRASTGCRGGACCRSRSSSRIRRSGARRRAGGPHGDRTPQHRALLFSVGRRPRR